MGCKKQQSRRFGEWGLFVSDKNEKHESNKERKIDDNKIGGRFHSANENGGICL
jgi:hypothetical protein